MAILLFCLPNTTSPAIPCGDWFGMDSISNCPFSVSRTVMIHLFKPASAFPSAISATNFANLVGYPLNCDTYIDFAWLLDLLSLVFLFVPLKEFS